MSTSLTVLRQLNEPDRLGRLALDDARTALPPGSAEALRREIDGEVRFDKGARALYATDGSNYRQAPIGAVIPRHAQDVETTVRLARQFGAPILSRGGGTSLAGQCCNVAVVMDFSEYLLQVPKIAVEVLEDAGPCVQVSQADVCCGRPLYDYGLLGMAKRWWREMLVKLRPMIRAGTPMVVLEPSCWASFKDELSNLLPEEMDAVRLKELTYTLSDFLRKHVPDYHPPKLNRKAIVHGHCHQKALDALNDKEFGKLFAEKDILTRMGVDHDHPDAGCCGMAGAFGYEREHGHYDVAVAVGERVLLPEVRKADDGLVIIADGFSCQEQIQQDTDRHALHLAQVLQMAKRDGPTGPPGRPEAFVVEGRARMQRIANVRTSWWLDAFGTSVLGMAAVVGLLVWSDRKRKAKGLS